MPIETFDLPRTYSSQLGSYTKNSINEAIENSSAQFNRFMHQDRRGDRQE